MGWTYSCDWFDRHGLWFVALAELDACSFRTEKGRPRWTGRSHTDVAAGGVIRRGEYKWKCRLE